MIYFAREAPKYFIKDSDFGNYGFIYKYKMSQQGLRKYQLFWA